MSDQFLSPAPKGLEERILELFGGPSNAAEWMQNKDLEAMERRNEMRAELEAAGGGPLLDRPIPGANPEVPTVGDALLGALMSAAPMAGLVGRTAGGGNAPARAPGSRTLKDYVEPFKGNQYVTAFRAGRAEGGWGPNDTFTASDFKMHARMASNQEAAKLLERGVKEGSVEVVGTKSHYEGGTGRQGQPLSMKRLNKVYRILPETKPHDAPGSGTLGDYVELFSGGGTGANWTTDPKRAASFARNPDDVLRVIVPRSVFEAGNKEAAKFGQPSRFDAVLPGEWANKATRTRVEPDVYTIEQPTGPTVSAEAARKVVEDRIAARTRIGWKPEKTGKALRRYAGGKIPKGMGD